MCQHLLTCHHEIFLGHHRTLSSCVVSNKKWKLNNEGRQAICCCLCWQYDKTWEHIQPCLWWPKQVAQAKTLFFFPYQLIILLFFSALTKPDPKIQIHSFVAHCLLQLQHTALLVLSANEWCKLIGNGLNHYEAYGGQTPIFKILQTLFCILISTRVYNIFSWHTMKLYVFNILL